MEDVLDPSEWQLFEVPEEVSLEDIGPPRIRISLQNFQDYGKSIRDDDDDDHSDNEKIPPPSERPTRIMVDTS
jgi:hypothetical protein